MRKRAFDSVIFFAAVLRLAAGAPAASTAPQNPWPRSQLISPQTLLKEMQGKKKPAVVCVGFPFLYDSAHIPGARIEGPAREAAGIAKLKRWAQRRPKNAPVVIYCGCCPFRECPNIRPAYKALRQAGLTNIQVLDLPSNFATDWMDKGYPVTRAK